MLLADFIVTYFGESIDKQRYIVAEKTIIPRMIRWLRKALEKI